MFMQGESSCPLQRHHCSSRNNQIIARPEPITFTSRRSDRSGRRANLAEGINKFPSCRTQQNHWLPTQSRTQIYRANRTQGLPLGLRPQNSWAASTAVLFWLVPTQSARSLRPRFLQMVSVKKYKRSDFSIENYVNDPRPLRIPTHHSNLIPTSRPRVVVGVSSAIAHCGLNRVAEQGFHALVGLSGRMDSVGGESFFK